MEMLLAVAIGDAYGAGFEFIPHETLHAGNDGLAYRQNVRWRDVRPGNYTDDTCLTVALAEFLVSNTPWTHANLADAFYNAYARDPRPGFAPGFRGILSSISSGREFLERILPHSDASGSAMRVSPMGMLGTAREVIDGATWQASLTHASAQGIAAAQAAALAVFGAREGIVAWGGVGRWLNSLVPGYNWDAPVTSRIPNKGVPVVRAAVQALVAGPSLTGVLCAAVAPGGDVDTCAAIAMSIAASMPDAVDDLVPVLRDDLEDGKYGRSYIVELDAALRTWAGGR